MIVYATFVTLPSGFCRDYIIIKTVLLKIDGGNILAPAGERIKVRGHKYFWLSPSSKLLPSREKRLQALFSYFVVLTVVSTGDNAYQSNLIL